MENTILYPIPYRGFFLIVVRTKSWPLVLSDYSAANDCMPEAEVWTSLLFTAPAGSPLPISHPLPSICRSSRAIRRLYHPEPRPIFETRYFCFFSLSSVSVAVFSVLRLSGRGRDWNFLPPSTSALRRATLLRQPPRPLFRRLPSALESISISLFIVRLSSRQE